MDDGFFVSCSRGLEYLLCDELVALGAREACAQQAGVRARGSLACALRAVMFSRFASRVLWPLTRFACDDYEQLYQGARAIAWADHLDVKQTFAIDAHVSGEQLNHSQFAAQKLKDAVVDALRDAHGARPSVDRQAPDVLLGLVVRRGEASVSIDLGGCALHRRGLRRQQGAAPLKETLAAALLARADFLAAYQAGAALLDPMCGSATILLEAACIAADQAPGLTRHAGRPPSRWLGLPADAWPALQREAEARAQAGRAALKPLFFGSDNDPQVLRAAEENVHHAGFSAHIRLQLRDIAQLPAQRDERVVVVCNPPYDARMATDESSYRALGQALRRACAGGRAAILCGNEQLARATTLRAQKIYKLVNGALPCLLLRCDRIAPLDAAGDAPKVPSLDSLSPGAQMVANRIQKNLRKRAPWAKKQQIMGYRLYDGDLPEYAAAIDVYELGEQPGARRFACISEPRAPKSVAQADAQRRRGELLRAVCAVLQLPRDRVVLHVQGEPPPASAPAPFVIREEGIKLRVDLRFGGEPGARLDQRLLRARLAKEAENQRYLQLYGGDGALAARVAARAAHITVVDPSDSGLDAVAEQCGENGFAAARRTLLCRDPRAWLQQSSERFDRIGFEVPLSLHTRGDFANDHPTWCALIVQHLQPGGAAYLSVRYQRFRLDFAALEALGCQVQEISEQTLPEDFARSHRNHRTFLLRATQNPGTPNANPATPTPRR